MIGKPLGGEGPFAKIRDTRFRGGRKHVVDKAAVAWITARRDSASCKNKRRADGITIAPIGPYRVRGFSQTAIEVTKNYELFASAHARVDPTLKNWNLRQELGASVIARARRASRFEVH